jgi:hypothetical protein
MARLPETPVARCCGGAPPFGRRSQELVRSEKKMRATDPSFIERTARLPHCSAPCGAGFQNTRRIL